MGVQTTANLESGQKEAFERMVDEGDADTQSEALRRTVNIGLSELGYLNGTPQKDRETSLRAIARRFADAFALLGVSLLGLTWLWPIEFRMFVVAPFAGSLACYGLDRGLAVCEPAVSNRIVRVFRRGEKA